MVVILVPGTWILDELLDDGINPILVYPCIHVCMYVCIYICLYVCVYVTGTAVPSTRYQVQVPLV